MSKKLTKPRPIPLYERVRDILESAGSSVARTVNVAQVVANWLIGREIVQEQQQGRKRAAYGEELLASLAQSLRADGIMGYSLPNLRFMRQFFLLYPELIDPTSIRYAARRESGLAQTGENCQTPHRRRSQRADPVPGAIGHALRSESWQPGRLHPNLSWTH